MALDELTRVALFTTVAVAVLAVVAAIILGLRAWRDLQRVRLTQQVAVQLVDAHAARLLDSVDDVSARMATVADGGEQLASHVAELRGDVDHLRWMLNRIPESREELRDALVELVLPTDDRATEREHADA